MVNKCDGIVSFSAKLCIPATCNTHVEQMCTVETRVQSRQVFILSYIKCLNVSEGAKIYTLKCITLIVNCIVQ